MSSPRVQYLFRSKKQRRCPCMKAAVGAVAAGSNTLICMPFALALPIALLLTCSLRASADLAPNHESPSPGNRCRCCACDKQGRHNESNQGSCMPRRAAATTPRRLFIYYLAVLLLICIIYYVRAAERKPRLRSLASTWHFGC